MGCATATEGTGALLRRLTTVGAGAPDVGLTTVGAGAPTVGQGNNSLIRDQNAFGCIPTGNMTYKNPGSDGLTRTRRHGSLIAWRNIHTVHVPLQESKSRLCLKQGLLW